VPKIANLYEGVEQSKYRVYEMHKEEHEKSLFVASSFRTVNE